VPAGQGLERLFDGEVGEEQSVADTALLQQFSRHFPLLTRAITPVRDLMVNVDQCAPPAKAL
jgi:hypothetical protein